MYHHHETTTGIWDARKTWKNNELNHDTDDRINGLLRLEEADLNPGVDDNINAGRYEDNTESGAEKSQGPI